MVRSKKRLYLMIALVSLLLMWSYCGTSSSTDDGGGTKHLLDRPWVTKIPKDPREPTNALFFLSRDKIGASVNGSSYQHLVTLFRHRTKGNKLTIDVLQAKKRFTTLARTYECKGPQGLDLCLDLGPRVKKVRLYSSSKWRVGEEGTPKFGSIDFVAAPAQDSLEATDEIEGLRLLTE